MSEKELKQLWSLLDKFYEVNVMKINITTTIDAKEIDTQGKHAYVVALCCGGLMEDPEIHYEDYQIIYADSADEARRKYNEINDCSYFYGSVIEQIE